jgi:peptidoglycan/xylan/chitin deacetylase (PgdA/CDA1 family)
VAAGELIGEAGARVRLHGVPILMYHGLLPPGATPPPGEARYWLSAGTFRAQLELIRSLGHHGEAVRGLLERRTAQGPPPVGITFDDGRMSDHAVAYPLLREFGFRADFFVNTATIGQAGRLDWPRILEMHRGGMSIQSHGHDHVALVRLSPALLMRQLADSRRRLEDRLGGPVELVAVPYGLVSRRVVERALAAGYRAVCTSRSWPAQLGSTALGRLAIYPDTTPSELARLLGGRPGPYLARVAREALLSVPKQVLVRLRPGALGIRVAHEGEGPCTSSS